MRNTQRSRRIVEHRDYELVNGKLVSRNREQHEKQTASERERRRDSDKGEYYFIPRKTGIKTYKVKPRDTETIAGRKIVVWDITRYDGKTVTTETDKTTGKKIEHKTIQAETLGQAWKLIEAIEG